MAILSPLKADCIIFDVDGVLMDTAKSFPEVIRESIPRVWEHILGRNNDSSPFTVRHFEVSKRFSFLNDDYDICWGILSLAAAKGKNGLDESFPTPWEWEEKLKEAEDSGQTFTAWVKESIGDILPYEQTRKICEELYFGEEKTLEILRRKPVFEGDPGLWRNERPLLNRNWRKIPLPVGIYTGRSRKELSLALLALGWEDLPGDRAVCSDDGIKKPSPEGLETVCHRLGKSWPLFFGDTASDRAALKAFGRGDFIAIGNILKDSEFRFSKVEDAIRALGLSLSA
ncbi:HAD family hydrolase [Dethiosulfovibrio salsuginis]|uniref:Phosphoglycolate phosphatase, HAD superfamily n=1 Tax=Dethiosulfovibrio salsuginis TaxID=561720 RepID=A0A1X7JSZ8_9BACT|nr:HAD family hydrolase [Dethiosulfovibrio salsuginis]SMG30746.1 Phosphoglycolate phosphatase, HAD superfamily [Dethiosulfovibrio salsuginis]